MIVMHIVLVGFGAVGFVLIQVLEEIARRKGIVHTYTIIVRQDTISDDLHVLGITAHVMVVSDTQQFFAQGTALEHSVDWTINCATPLLNVPIMQRCLHNHSHYMDFASILNPGDVETGILPQHQFHQAFVDAGLLAVINAGISP